MSSPTRASSARLTRMRVLTIVASLAVALPFALSSRSSETLATWTDSEVASGSFAAATVGPPRNGTCTAGWWLSPTFYWFHPNTGLPRTSYHVVVTQNGVTIVNNAALSYAATSYMIDPGLLQIGSGTFALRAVSGTWESTPITATYTVKGLGFELDTTCTMT